MRPDDPLRLMATGNPNELLKLLVLSDIRESSGLTSFAEAAGFIGDPELAVPVLGTLVSHKSALVREGVVIGLAGHTSYWMAAMLLVWMAENDENPDVRLTAAEVVAGARNNL